MREIKFRAWDKEIKKFHGTFALPLIGSYTVGVLHDRAAVIELSQYTGLRDKNGKEIYEGDVIEWSEAALWAVRYNQDKAQYEVYDHVYSRNQATFALCSMKKKSVIGNIYEHPELLANKEV